LSRGSSLSDVVTREYRLRLVESVETAWTA